MSILENLIRDPEKYVPTNQRGQNRLTAEQVTVLKHGLRDPVKKAEALHELLELTAPQIASNTAVLTGLFGRADPLTAVCGALEALSSWAESDYSPENPRKRPESVIANKGLDWALADQAREFGLTPSHIPVIEIYNQAADVFTQQNGTSPKENDFSSLSEIADKLLEQSGEKGARYRRVSHTTTRDRLLEVHRQEFPIYLFQIPPSTVDPSVDMDEPLDQLFASKDLRIAVEKLPHPQRRVIEAVYGLNDSKPVSLAQYARENNLNPSAAQAYLQRGLDHLARDPKALRHRPY